MSEKIKLVICMGSSCYSCGNSKILDIITNYLEINNFKDKIDLSGNLCLDKCKNGPNILVNDKLYSGINENNIIEILNYYLKNEK